jgi:hypothetical protein
MRPPLAVVVLLVLSSSAVGADLSTPTAASPVVLELFTSQGCSSCPPADRVLSRLGHDSLPHGAVVSLEFHVDYWNQAGWVDPLGARDWTERQLAYERALGNGMYTPQLVVNGSTHFPGGNEPRARVEIASRSAQTAAAVVTLTARKVGGKHRAVTVQVSAQMAAPVQAHRLDVLVALFENHLLTTVEHGENQGHELENDFVVRRLERALRLDPAAGTRRSRSLTLKVDAAWRAENLGVAAFVQDPASMQIHGAALVSGLE